MSWNELGLVSSWYKLKKVTSYSIKINYDEAFTPARNKKSDIRRGE